MKRNKSPYLPTSWGDVPVLLELKDAAQIVGLTPERLTQLAKLDDPDKRFPAGKVGCAWRVEKGSFIDYLKRQGIIATPKENIQ